MEILRLDIIAFWNGGFHGLGIFGAILGGFLAILLYTWRHRLKLIRWLDIIVPVRQHGDTCRACGSKGVAQGERDGHFCGYICGQEHVKRALEVAAAGAHNCLMTGSPGAGKTLTHAHASHVHGWLARCRRFCRG